MNKDLMAAYGQACVELEIAQNRHAELKRAIVEEMNKNRESKPEVKPEEPKPEPSCD